MGWTYWMYIWKEHLDHICVEQLDRTSGIQLDWTSGLHLYRASGLNIWITHLDHIWFDHLDWTSGLHLYWTSGSHIWKLKMVLKRRRKNFRITWKSKTLRLPKIKKRQNIYRHKIIKWWWREKEHEVHIQASTKLLEVFRAENPEFLFTQLGPQNCQSMQPIRIIGNSLICMERTALWEMVGKGAHHNRKRTLSAWILRGQQVP